MGEIDCVVEQVIQRMLDDDPDCVLVLGILRRDGVRLAFGWLHLQELSAPTFRSRRETGMLLDNLALAWCPAPATAQRSCQSL